MAARAAIKMNDLILLAEECPEEIRNAASHRSGLEAWPNSSDRAVVCGFYIFLNPSFVFYFEGGAPHRVLLGKGTEPLCIQNSDPFSCHLNEDRGEGRGGRDDLRKEGSKHANRKEIFNPETAERPCPIRVLRFKISAMAAVECKYF